MGILSLFKRKTKNDSISLENGQGDCKKNAIVIHVPNSITGIMAEYKYLEDQYGVQDVDWKLCMQSLVTGNGKSYDLLTIEIKDGTRKSFYFDITDFFGKF
ncbi:MAG: hypothetical protein P8185_02470 [Deltaproteobacteria bacterium]|jgi:hypothetical protein